MDESFKTQLILAARTGKLTDQQYELYLKLLEDDPSFREQAAWEDFLEDNLAVSKDAAMYEEMDKYKFTRSRPILLTYTYRIAASITVILVTGWLIYQLGFQKAKPEMMGSGVIDLYNGENQNQGQLGYSEGDLPAAELRLQWWKDPGQQAKISYRFCAQTLHLYVRDPVDTLFFNQRFKLYYLPGKQQYFLKAQDSIQIKLLDCSKVPNPVVR